MRGALHLPYKRSRGKLLTPVSKNANDGKVDFTRNISIALAQPQQWNISYKLLVFDS